MTFAGARFGNDVTDQSKCAKVQTCNDLFVRKTHYQRRGQSISIA